MKRAEIKQLYNKTKEELLALLNETRSSLFKAKMDLSQNKLKNTSLLREKKDDIARILTVLKEAKNA